jgi:hypothetical protein
VHTIFPATDLPTIVIAEGLTIDGTTQPGYAGTPLIELHRDAVNGGGGATCLNFSFTPATVTALVINRCATGINSSNGGGLTVKSCYIGTDAAGTAPQPNGTGIFLANGTTNTIGGSTSAERNVISGNSGSAMQLLVGSTGTIRGNYIGVDVTGAAALPNAGGISCSNVSGLVIGGATAADGNVISGSTGGPGITLGTCSNAVVKKNLIGTNALGTAAIGNLRGIEVDLGSGVQIGGAPGGGNVISGNGVGIQVTASDAAVIQGNLIGTDASGTLPIPNNIGAKLNGTHALFGTSTPGGPGANVVVFNGIGVEVPGLTTNTVRGNSIHDNQFLGIDVAVGGLTSNDAGDTDNGQQNFPNIASAVVEGAGVRVIGSIDTTPSGTVRPRLLRGGGVQPVPAGPARGRALARHHARDHGRDRPCGVQRPSDARHRPAGFPRDRHGDRLGRHDVGVLAAHRDPVVAADRPSLGRLHQHPRDAIRSSGDRHGGRRPGDERHLHERVQHHGERARAPARLDQQRDRDECVWGLRHAATGLRLALLDVDPGTSSGRTSAAWSQTV